MLDSTSPLPVVDVPGQQTLNLDLPATFPDDSHRDPVRDAIRIARMPLHLPLQVKLAIINRRWDDASALDAFTAYADRTPDDEEAAFNTLLDVGCPLDLANKAWDQWARGAGHAG
ncbi:MAG TPA: hypothetical protein VHU40_03050 [Polyangia bacterium]|nr:hypothetical protein [Polyangia bacterium]